MPTAVVEGQKSDEVTFLNACPLEFHSTYKTQGLKKKITDKIKNTSRFSHN